MKIKDFVLFVLISMMAGAVIGIGGVASLASNAFLNLPLSMPLGKIVGAVLFSFGLFVVISCEMKLYTGMIARVPSMKKSELWQLFLCFVGNALGMAVLAFLVYNTFLGETVARQGAQIVAGKLSDSDWMFKAFCSAILCGMLITFSVLSVTEAPKKGLSATFGVVMPIFVFAFCGFDHSVANMLYIYFYAIGHGMSWDIVWYVLIVVLGNLLGGVLLPYWKVLQKKWEQKE